LWLKILRNVLWANQAAGSPILCGGREIFPIEEQGLAGEKL
jgi:hypothetical protein